ncbi:MAG: hypothetical protein JSS49_30125 [Planctomycetes bacterium]|nr:hypothetical protein [Planctomycetota bacterium]
MTPKLDTFISQQKWVSFRSLETTRTIPPFAVLQLGIVTDRTQAELDETTGEYTLLASRPYKIGYPTPESAPISQSIVCDDIAFNGPIEVLPGENGVLTFDSPCIAMFDGATSGILTPQTPFTGDAQFGFALQNTFPHNGLDTTVISCFRRIGFINYGQKTYAVVQRTRAAAPEPRNPTIAKYSNTGQMLWQRPYDSTIDPGGTLWHNQFLVNKATIVDGDSTWSIGSEANHETSVTPPQLIRTDNDGYTNLTVGDFAAVAYDVDADSGIVAFGNMGGPQDSSWATATGWQFHFFDADGVPTGSCSPATSPNSISLQSKMTVHALPNGDVLSGWFDAGSSAWKMARFDRTGTTIWIRTSPVGTSSTICGVTTDRFMAVDGTVMKLSDGTTVGSFASVAPFSSPVFRTGIAIGDELPVSFLNGAAPFQGIAVLDLSTIATSLIWEFEPEYAGSDLSPPTTYGWPSDPVGRVAMDESRVYASRKRVGGSANYDTVFAINRDTGDVDWEQNRKQFGVDVDVDSKGSVFAAGVIVVGRIKHTEFI